MYLTSRVANQTLAPLCPQRRPVIVTGRTGVAPNELSSLRFPCAREIRREIRPQTVSAAIRSGNVPEPGPGITRQDGRAICCMRRDERRQEEGLREKVKQRSERREGAIAIAITACE